MHHNDQLDYIIMNAINDNVFAFNKLCKECKASPRTLSSHLKKLQEEGMTKWHPSAQYGHHGKWELTAVGKAHLEYGLALDIESKRKKKETKEEEAKRKEGERNLFSVKLLLYTAAVGAMYGKLVSEPSAGDLVVKSRSTGKWQPYHVTIKEGVSVEDIVDRKLINPRLNFAEFSKEKLENLINVLTKGKNPILTPMKYEDGEIRFGIADPILRDFICDCFMIFDNVIKRMEYTWTFVRPPKKGRSKGGQSPEVEWYSWICGNRYAGAFFASLDERRRYQYDIDRERCIELLDHYRMEFKGKSPTEDELSEMHRKVTFDHNVHFDMKRKEGHVRFDDEQIRMCVTNLDKHNSVYDDAQLEQRYPIVKIIRKKIFPEFLSNYQKQGKI